MGEPRLCSAETKGREQSPLFWGVKERPFHLFGLDRFWAGFKGFGEEKSASARGLKQWVNEARFLAQISFVFAFFSPPPQAEFAADLHCPRVRTRRKNVRGCEREKSSKVRTVKNELF